MVAVLPALVEWSAGRYVADVERALPGRLAGFYVVGSTALGAYRPSRSDIDFVAVLDDGLSAQELERLRRLHARSGVRTAARAARERRSPLSGACNGLFVRTDDLTRPAGRIRPLATQTGHRFEVGSAPGEVTPVDWKVLAEGGIPVRGPRPADLGLDPEPERLAAWNVANLRGYWAPWADAVEAAPRRSFGPRPRWSTAWGVLGAPRLHCTIATGAVVSKEAAGAYALQVFDRRYHPLIADALAYRREEPAPRTMGRAERAAQTVDFVRMVIDHALTREGRAAPHDTAGT